MKQLKTDLCILGAGAAGLSVASVAAQLGLDVVLVEAHKMGGECLNVGCVPSKSLLAAAKRAFMYQNAGPLGVTCREIDVNFVQVHDFVKNVITQLAPHDSKERFESLGVKVLQEQATFIGPKTIQTDTYRIEAKRFVIATGSNPSIPPIEGIDQVNYLTNESIFDLKEKPEHLLVIGGGPIGCEMAQAYAMLGCKVSVFEMASILPKDDPELVEVVRQQLINAGVSLYEQVNIKKVVQQNQRITITTDTQQNELTGSHLLVAAGRRAHVNHLNLEKANVQYTQKGVQVDAHLRTTNRRIYALGDVIGQFQFTHAASYQAGVIIRNMLFKLPKKVDYHALPWVTYTHPELAHVGLTETQAKTKNLTYTTEVFRFSDVDRAHAENETQGLIKVIVDKKARVMGASIVSTHAGELIVPWIEACQARTKLKHFTNLIFPYPTWNEVTKHLASQYYRPFLFSKNVKHLIRWLWFLG